MDDKKTYGNSLERGKRPQIFLNEKKIFTKPTDDI